MQTAPDSLTNLKILTHLDAITNWTWNYASLANFYFIHSGRITTLLLVFQFWAHKRQTWDTHSLTPLIHWLQLTQCCSCPVRRKLKKPIKIGFLLPAAISQESEMATLDLSMPPSQWHWLMCRYTCKLLLAQVRKIKAVGCLMTE